MRSLQLDDSDDDAWSSLGEVYLALARYEDALKCFRSALSSSPVSTYALVNYLTVSSVIGDDDAVLAEYRDRVCFTIMPFGEKTDVQGKPGNFDRIYDDFIVPTLEIAGLACERCDRIDEAGNIHRRMFQLIWAADVALVDLSLLNPNVFYELGIRHALRRSVTILIRRKGAGIPFNVSNLDVVEYDETDERSLDIATSRLAST